MPANNRTGDLPSLPRIFPHYPARTRTRDGALEHAELAPGSDDATKKLDAKGRPVDFKQLLRIQRHYQRPQARARIEGAGLIWRAAVSCRSRRFPDTIDGKKLPRSGSLPRRAALFSHSRALWTNWTSVRKAKQGEIPADIFALLTCEPNAEVGRIPAKAKAVILTTTAVARCYDDCGQVRGFPQRGQTGVVLERGVGRHEEGERSTKRIRRTPGETS